MYKNRYISFVTCFILVILNSFSVVFANQDIVTSEELVVKIKEIIDLDQLETEDGEKIKIYGVSKRCYEIYEEKFKNGIMSISDDGYEYGISKAEFKSISIEDNKKDGIKFLEDFLKGKVVNLKLVEDNKYEIWLNKECVNSLLVREGYVTVLESLSNSNIDKELRDAENVARTTNRGLWKISFYTKSIIPPSEWNLSVSIDKSIAIGLFLLSLVLNKMGYRWIGGFLFFITCLLNFISFLVINPSYNLKELLYNIIFNSILIITYVRDIIKYVFYNKKLKILKMIIRMVIIVLWIIILFAELYIIFSINDFRCNVIQYSLPNFEIIDSRLSNPLNNYLYIPEDYNVDISNFQGYRIGIIDAIYFSAVTFFTVGYGDITPRGILRVISICEMTLGYFIQIILFSSIVTKYLSKLNNKK